MPLSHWGSPFIGGSKLRGEQATPLLSPSSQPAPGARLRMELRTGSLEERTGQCCFSSHRDVHSLEIILTTLEERASLILITEKAMAPHSSTLAWKIPWMEEPGRLQSMGSQRMRRDLVTKQQKIVFCCFIFFFSFPSFPVILGNVEVT